MIEAFLPKFDFFPVHIYPLPLPPSQHKQGEIKHVFRGNIFLVVRDQVENGGIVVAKAKHVELAGGTSHAVSCPTLSRGFLSLVFENY